MIEVLNPGFYTLIQDQGRFGYQEFGMPVSGALDLDSYRLANWLVQNIHNEAILEVTLSGPTLKFHKNTQIAITGANMQPIIDGVLVLMYQTITVEKGSVLSFKGLLSGCRAYIAISGGVLLENEMGSKSTYAYANLGGFKGRKLLKKDTLKLKTKKNVIKRCIPKDFHPNYFSLLSVRVIEGPEAFLFSQEEIHKFYSTEFEILPESNRMGFRLKGQQIQYSSPFEMLSSGVVKGTIQIPVNGQPIVLLSDTQTTGGYPRIGNVIQIDLPLLAQQKPGDRIRFRIISLKEAQSLAYNKETSLRRFLES